MSIVKRQHYVWRKYLRAWAENEQIWTCLKELNKIEKINVMGVAQERYFYQHVDISPESETLLKLFIERNSHPSLTNSNLSYISMFKEATLVKNKLAALKTDNESRNKELEKSIREIELNFIEKIMGLVENFG